MYYNVLSFYMILACYVYSCVFSPKKPSSCMAFNTKDF